MAPDDTRPRDRRPPTAAEARAAAEAERDNRRQERAAAMARHYADGVPGRAIVVSSWASTVVFTVVTAAAAIDPDRFVAPFFVVSVVLFLLGCALFVVVLALAAARSRDDAMGIGGLFLLLGSAPSGIQRALLAALSLQCVVAIAGAAVRPFTPLAFGTLVPILGLACCGLWAVRHGMFDPRSGGA